MGSYFSTPQETCTTQEICITQETCTVQKKHTTQEKCATNEKYYDPHDSSLKFVDREDVLDCNKPSCYRLSPDVLWPRSDPDEVCKMALLTPEEMKDFETKLASNAFPMKSCPGCRSSVVRKNESNLRVHCTVCTTNKGRTFEFCWQCLKEWKGPAPRSDRCDNDGCCNVALKLLRECSDISFESVKGVEGCPSIRSCPTCGALVAHCRKYCKNVVCPRCTVEFCFGYFTLCSSGVAPRQTSIPVWQK
uniref:RING-type domain-containing protein n=1 Tax=Monopterus albus TaxID=43700 RepID=A0A3Q3JGW3_MONAL